MSNPARDPGDDASADSNLVRDHLANERTYLAWLRTTLAVMVLGLAIAQFSGGNRNRALAAGVILLLTGLTGLGYATVTYRRVSAQIQARSFVGPGRGRSAVVISVTLALVVITALVLLLTGG